MATSIDAVTTVYRMITKLLRAGERIAWLEFIPTKAARMDKAGNRRIPYNKRMGIVTGRDYLEAMTSDQPRPEIRLRTDIRDIYISPGKVARFALFNTGGLETIPFEHVTCSEVTQRGTS